MNLFNFRTILLFITTLAVGIYFVSWYISQQKIESAFVVKIQKAYGERLSADEIKKVEKDICRNTDLFFDRRYSFFSFDAHLVQVSIEKSGKVFGTAYMRFDLREIYDIESLKSHLKPLFKEREEFPVREICSDKIMKTVLLKSSRSIKYGEVVKVIDALKSSGAEPTVLQIDDLPN
jgi:biopolymer transport protein ExbD